MFTPSLRAAISNLEILRNKILDSKIQTPGIGYQLGRDIAALTEWADVYEPVSRRLPLDTMIAFHEMKLGGVDPEPYWTGTWKAFLATHGEEYPNLEAALCRDDEYDVATTRVRLAKREPHGGREARGER